MPRRADQTSHSLETLSRHWSAEASLYVKPVGLLSAATAKLLAAGKTRSLAGGPLTFTACELILRNGRRRTSAVASLAEIAGWRTGSALRDALEFRLELLSEPRPGGSGSPRIMGILNATPDSFSDGGAFLEPDTALSRALEHVAAGAAILDIGGESTRPGAISVDAATEITRVAPVLERLARRRPRELQGIELSIDTRRAAVMRKALDLGVDIINDVSALRDDPLSLHVAAASRARVVLMHKRGEPKEMNIDPRYSDVILDVFDELEARVATAIASGIERERLIVDPGIGFAKRSRENLAVLRGLALFHGLGCPLLLGVSRKALIGGEQRRLAPRERVPGSLAAAMYALEQGVQILRVHDVKETRQVVDLWRALHA